ncbi:MAG: carbonic anhydrase [Gammaproteobacteria bacterium]|nr:carbonic anhydrase [Gammaproteobacteria bacterium]
MLSIDQLLERNRRWANGQIEKDPTFFATLAEEHEPQICWIGCSDGRVSPENLIPMPAGTFFVHRNIGNVFAVGDLNCLAVLQYAVEELRVPRIIVCGHYRCGGIRAAMTRQSTKPVDLWTDHIRQLARLHDEELHALPDETQRLQRMTELNVASQVRNICRTAIIQETWKRGQPLAISGFVYDVSDGLLRSVTPDIDSATRWKEWDG